MSSIISMHFLLPIFALLAYTMAEYTTSAPFHLVIDAPNTKRDNITLYACEASGPYHALCPDYLNPTITPATSTFHLNTSSNTGSDPNSGFLALDVYYEEVNYTDSHLLVFSYAPTTNVATPLFSALPNEEWSLSLVTVYFDESGHLGVRSNFDETADPPNLQNWVTYYKWYICAIFDGEKRVDTLSWIIGKYDTPQDPTCESVGVRRIWD